MTQLIRVQGMVSVSRFRRREGRASFVHVLRLRTQWVAPRLGPENPVNGRTLAGETLSSSRSHFSPGADCYDSNSPFVLLAGTTIGLLIVIVGSITLLYKVGEAALPSTLTGGVGGLKTD